MIKTILIEDERLIADEFKHLLRQASADTELVATFGSAKESIEWLSANEEPDLIFSDIQLPDGLSFTIFNAVQVKSPVIFVTAYDQFMVNAFEQNGIGYLLKPIDEKELSKALIKYKNLKEHFSGYRNFLDGFRQKTRSRLIVRKGIENVALRMEDIAIIYTEEKLVFALSKDGKKWIVDKTLAELEEELDLNLFFRANRQYIVNVGYIRSYKAYEKVKLQIDLSLPDVNRQIVISQEMAPAFRRWISES